MASVEVKEKIREPENKFQEKNDELKTKWGGGAGPIISKWPHKPIAVFCVLILDKTISNICLDKGIYRIIIYLCTN